MNCFTVHERVEPGLRAYTLTGTWFLRMGNQPATHLAVAEPLRDLLQGYTDSVKARAEGDMTHSEYGIPFVHDANGKVDKDASMTAAREGLEEIEAAGLEIEQHLDWDYDEGVLGFAGKACNVAIVAVVPLVAPGGKLIYTSSMYDEQLRGGRVAKNSRPFNDSVGVEPLVTGVSDAGEAHTVVRMLPGSSFRLERTVPLLNDGWETLQVTWNGRQLRGLPWSSKRPVRQQTR